MFIDLSRKKCIEIKEILVMYFVYMCSLTLTYIYSPRLAGIVCFKSSITAKRNNRSLDRNIQPKGRNNNTKYKQLYLAPAHEVQHSNLSQQPHPQKQICGSQNNRWRASDIFCYPQKDDVHQWWCMIGSTTNRQKYKSHRYHTTRKKRERQ